MNRQLLTSAAVVLTGMFGATAAATANTSIELRLVPQAGALPGPIVNGDANSPWYIARNSNSVQRTVRLELQYRIRDLNKADAIRPCGLQNAAIVISRQITQPNSTAPGAATTNFSRGVLSQDEAWRAGLTPPTQVDSSGWSTNLLTGTHRPFRDMGTVSGRAVSFSNGTPTTTGITNIKPLSLTPSMQGSAAHGVADQWYGLYSFNVVVDGAAAADVKLKAEVVNPFPPAPGQNEFPFFTYYTYPSGSAMTSYSTAPANFTIKFNQSVGPILR